MPGRRLGSALVVFTLLVVSTVSPVAAKVPLRVCKQTCTNVVGSDCAGLTKRKLRRCRALIWKRCKRGKVLCPGASTTTTLATTTTLLATTTTTLPAPTGTVTFDLDLPAESAPQFVGSGTFDVSISNDGAGKFGASASWGGGSLFVQTPVATCGTNPTTYGLGDVSGTLFTEPVPLIGELLIKVPLTTPAGACPFDSSGFLSLIFDGDMLTPDLVRFFRVCVDVTNCYDTQVTDSPAVSVGGVIQITP